ncbi:predicted protein [Postia placenta Mad-698-R]|nr:predicted protein [Postia placenta Mad-698-R]
MVLNGTMNIQYWQVSWELFISGIPILSALISMVVQVFYAWRMWLLSNRKLLILAGIVVILALGQFVCGCIAAMAITNSNPLVPYYSADTPISFAPIMGWLGGGALVDIIIGIAMFILLRKSRRGEKETDILLNRLVKHIVGSGIVTACSRLRRLRTAPSIIATLCVEGVMRRSIEYSTGTCPKRVTAY